MSKNAFYVISDKIINFICLSVHKDSSDPKIISPKEFLDFSMNGCVIQNIILFPLQGKFAYRTYKVTIVDPIDNKLLRNDWTDYDEIFFVLFFCVLILSQALSTLGLII